ncbi:Gfo/Idh/MocA family protein [Silvimonas soli]|uniref:Gfo/Idh/MocA family protein n=1 Tax=Silvimonas soli TaxID=2980100 RepID=UPI0024B34635|nr:Gfo/Idh/MocA family oxidoreductase [Silvimonas soli]
MNHPVKIGMIGCGVAARELHWPALQAVTEHVELVAICNRTAQKAQHFSAMSGGVDWYVGWDELLARPDIEAVDIVLPATENLRATRAALAAGKHVLVEKPLAATEAEAQEMLALAAQYPHLITMVAENFRYAAAFERIKQWLDSGEAGRPYALNWNAMTLMQEDNRYLASGWRSSEAFPGGLVLDAGVHYIAVVRDLLGEISRASLSPSQVNPKLGQLDGAMLSAQTASGVNVTLNLYFSAAAHNEWRLVLLAEHGAAIYDGRKLLLTSVRPDKTREWRRDDDDGYAAEMRAFARAIRSGQPVTSDFAAGWRDMQVITRTLAQPGQWVTLD